MTITEIMHQIPHPVPFRVIRKHDGMDMLGCVSQTRGGMAIGEYGFSMSLEEIQRHVGLGNYDLQACE